MQLRKQHYALSARHSRRALELDPEYNYARHNLAVAYFHQERYGDSEREALQTLAENPRRTDTRVLLGRIYLATNKPQQAAAYLRRALEQDPESGTAHYYYGRLLYRQGHYAHGCNLLAAGACLAATGFLAALRTGEGPYSRPGKPRLHSASTHRALSLERRPEALNAIGALHLLAERIPAARTHFLQALELDPDNPDVHVNLALIELENGNHAAAIDRLRQVLARGPSPHAQRLLDEAYRRLEAP